MFTDGGLNNENVKVKTGKIELQLFSASWRGVFQMY